MWRSILPLIFAVAAGVVQAQTQEDSAPSVTPYRPSVSTPAALSAPGWLEAEAGGVRVHNGGSARQDSLPYTLKLAFSPDWGVRVAGNAYIRDTDSDGRTLRGAGDTAIVLKRRFGVDDASAFGLEAGANLPTAREGLGSGKTDYSVNAIYSADIGEVHTDLNLFATRFGAVDAGTGRTQTGWAASLSRQINPQWGAVGEFSGTRQRGESNTSQFLVAGSYNVSKAATLDLGVSRALQPASSNWSVFSGVTMLVGRLF